MYLYNHTIKHLHTFTILPAMKVISIANQKGGAGKSTLLVVLATALAVDYNYQVLVIDGDPQSSIANLRNGQDKLYLEEEREFLEDPALDFPYEVVSVDLAAIPDYVEQQQDKYDVVFVDLPGRADSEALNNTLAASEVVLVPMKATYVDRQATLDFLQVLKKLAEFCAADGLEFKAFGVSSSRTASREERLMDEFADLAGLPRFKSSLTQRVTYTRMSTLFSFLNPDYLKRIEANRSTEQEVRALCDELIERAELVKSTTTTNA